MENIRLCTACPANTGLTSTCHFTCQCHGLAVQSNTGDISHEESIIRG